MSGEGPIAVLPMYDFPWIAAANDALWASISARLAEPAFDRRRGLLVAGSWPRSGAVPGLILGQTCGYPYVSGLKDAVRLIATPEYGFPGCEGASHRSFIIRGAATRAVL